MMSAAAMRLALGLGQRLALLLRQQRAMSPARSRIRPAALRMILLRSMAGMSRQVSKPFCAAASARSRSAVPACAHAADLLAGGRVEDGQRAAVGGVLPFAVDEELGVGVGHRGSCETGRRNPTILWQMRIGRAGGAESRGQGHAGHAAAGRYFYQAPAC